MGFGRGRKYFLGVLITVTLIGLPSFFRHFYWFVSGQVSNMVVQGQWGLVLINILGFLAFLVPLQYRKKTDWKSLGVYSAFIVSLFVEMYGIPLTIYLSSSFLPSATPAVSQGSYIFEISILGVELGMTFWMAVGGIITFLGMVLIGVGWYTIYYSEDELVTSGVYSFSRHPQYLGIILLSLGWFIGWPSLLTTALFPVVVYSYYNLSFKEEEEVMKSLESPGEYEKYRQEVPMLI